MANLYEPIGFKRTRTLAELRRHPGSPYDLAHCAEVARAFKREEQEKKRREIESRKNIFGEQKSPYDLSR